MAGNHEAWNIAFNIEITRQAAYKNPHVMMTDKEPLWAITPDKIDEAVRRIVYAAQPLQVILFGSAAKGQTDRDSDVDLLVIEREVKNRHAETVRLHRALKGLIMPVDIIVIAQKDFEDWMAFPGSVYRAAHDEGKVLYEAA